MTEDEETKAIRDTIQAGYESIMKCNSIIEVVELSRTLISKVPVLAVKISMGTVDHRSALQMIGMTADIAEMILEALTVALKRCGSDAQWGEIKRLTLLLYAKEGQRSMKIVEDRASAVRNLLQVVLGK